MIRIEKPQDLPWWRSRLEHLKEQEPDFLRSLWGQNKLKEHLDRTADKAQELNHSLQQNGLSESQAREIVQADVVSPIDPREQREEGQPPSPQLLSQLSEWEERLAES